MVTKLVSSKRVIAKVLADLNLSESDIRISDWREWIGEAIEHIGALNQFVQKVSGVDNTPVLEIKGHQVQLPCDLHQLHSIAYSLNPCGPWRSMRKSTSSFAVWGSNCQCKGSCNFLGHCGCSCGNCNPDRIVHDDVLVQLAIDLLGNLDKTEALELINTNQNTRTILTNLINNFNRPLHFRNNKRCDLEYSLKPGYIMTNVPCGYLKIAYSAVAMDDEGYPLIPDMVSYSEAIYWYITMKFKYPEYLADRMRRETYYDIRRSWNFYRNQAYAEAQMPNVDELETLKNVWLNLYPEINEHDTFFRHTGEKQHLYNY